MARNDKFSVHFHFDLESWGINDTKEYVESLLRSAGLAYSASVYMQSQKTGSAYRKHGNRKWKKDKP